MANPKPPFHQIAIKRLEELRDQIVKSQHQPVDRFISINRITEIFELLRRCHLPQKEVGKIREVIEEVMARLKNNPPTRHSNVIFREGKATLTALELA